MYIVDMCIVLVCCVCIGVANACSSVVLYLYIYPACDVFSYMLYFHAWPTLCGRLAFGLSLSLRASPL